MKCVTFDGITLNDTESRHNTMNSFRIVTAPPAGIVNKYKNMPDHRGPEKTETCSNVIDISNKVCYDR